ncbi:MAG: S9 family peptidase [Sphingomonadaceae bacterium]
MNEIPRPPVAARRPFSYERHGQRIEDPWAWLRDRNYPRLTDPEIIAYLEAENAYFEAAMKPLAPLVDKLFEEIKGRIREDDSSVPARKDGWLYWWAFDEGAQYRKWYRRPVPSEAEGPVSEDEVELILDEPALAQGKDYFRLGAISVSPDARRLAYSIDVDGSERYEARIRDLASGEDLPDRIPDTLSSLVWSASSDALLYGEVNDKWRVDRIRLHRLGTPAEQDAVVYSEPDPGFQLGVGLTQSERFILLSTGDNETSEVYLIPREDPSAEPILVSPRQKGREYDVEEHEGMLFILTNDAHPNFRIATASVDNPGEWTELLAGSDETYLTGLTTFKDFMVVESRVHGLDRIALHDYAGGAPRDIEFPEASYAAGLGSNPEYDVDKIRIGYESMVTPDTVFDYHVATGELQTLKVREIPSGYDKSKYRTERLTIAARDGAKVPVSLVYPRDFKKDGSGPLHLYAYGAYGHAVPPHFSTARLSLLDRGFAYAIAHIRGGDDLGRNWYLEGKLDKRANSFNDFIDVAKSLIEAGFASPGRISISGGSAGGGLVGAVVNSDPELWGAAVAHVPFVDVLNTMLDESLPLTPGEWPEWGNPVADKAAFENIRSYSPYDQVKPQHYPPMLVTAGINDPRVTYWEPAKWAAKLRATRTDDNILLLKTNMGAGHGGKSGRWESLRETAEEYAFILWQLGMAEKG